jgi:hypothetical protein
MRMIGCDLHAAKQTIAMLDRETGEIVEHTLSHDGETVREFYAAIPTPAKAGVIFASSSITTDQNMWWPAETTG